MGKKLKKAKTNVVAPGDGGDVTFPETVVFAVQAGWDKVGGYFKMPGMRAFDFAIEEASELLDAFVRNGGEKFKRENNNKDGIDHELQDAFAMIGTALMVVQSKIGDVHMNADEYANMNAIMQWHAGVHKKLLINRERLYMITNLLSNAALISCTEGLNGVPGAFAWVYLALAIEDLDGIMKRRYPNGSAEEFIAAFFARKEKFDDNK